MPAEGDILEEDRIAMAEAYRAFEMLDENEKERVPADFVDTLLSEGDFTKVKRFRSKEEVDNYQFSRKAWYLIMYMCTFG
ncbi:MAG: hypothetical protein IKR04_03140 [Clostridia bacterium]|nr:hypothetical protein [Clostridia bacterium]